MNKDQELELLDKHCAILAEHFDSVQIITTRHTNDGSIYASRGAGNWFARKASLQEWLEREAAATEHNTIQRLSSNE